MAFFHIYKSSAGSGKTSVLVKSYLKLALATNDQKYYRKILAITFTNKAANEMKVRILEELETLSELNPDSIDHFMAKDLVKELNIKPEELIKRAQSVFNDVLQVYEKLAVSTIDTFNLMLIKSFSRELNIENDFTVETEEKKLFAEAIDNLIEQAGLDEHITKHLVNYVRYKLGDEKRVNLKSALESLFSLSTGEDSYEALEAYKQMDAKSFAEIEKTINREIQKIHDLFVQLGKRALDLIQGAGLDGSEFSQPKSGVYRFFQKLYQADLVKLEMNKYVEAALDGNWMPKRASSSDFSALATIQGDLEKILATSKRYLENELKEYYLLQAIRSNLDLLAVLDSLSKEFRKICSKKRVLPISRFNKIISDALQKEPVSFIYEQIGTRYNHILIDEFQDTSQLQWYNLFPLVEESIAQGKFSMVVGDAKQSIYRWRGGRAEQLISLPSLFEPPLFIEEGVKQNFTLNSTIHRLNTNYRSKENIVRFNNLFITALSNIAIDANSIYADEYKRVNLVQEVPKNKEGGYIEIIQLNEKPEINSEWNDLINQISRCREMGYAYSDMAILVRSANYEGKSIGKTLIEANIPVISPESFDIRTYSEVQIILAFLKLSISPNHNPSKIQVIKGLSVLRNKKYEPKAYTDNESLDINKFLKENGLPFFEPNDTISAYDAIEQIHEKYLENVDHPAVITLKSYVYQQHGIKSSIKSMLEYWDALSKKPSINIGDSENCIQLLTIHKAKGLQFKVVLLPDMTWNLSSNRPDQKWFKLSNPSIPLPFVPLTNSKKLVEFGLENEWNREEAAIHFDNLNLIYVALTRAEEALFIRTYSKNKGENHIGAWLNEAINRITNKDHMPDMDYDLEETDYSRRLEIGKLTKVESQSNLDPLRPSEIANFKPWKQNLQFARKIQNKEQRIGTIFHDLISQANDEKGYFKHLERLNELGKITKDEFAAIRDFGIKLYQDSFFKQMINEAQIYKEKELIFDNQVIRPDLILYQNEELCIIDFKTGLEMDENKKQIRQYIDACQRLENCTIKGFLVYLNPYKIVEVSKTSNSVQGTLF